MSKNYSEFGISDWVSELVKRLQLKQQAGQEKSLTAWQARVLCDSLVILNPSFHWGVMDPLSDVVRP